MSEQARKRLLAEAAERAQDWRAAAMFWRQLESQVDAEVCDLLAATAELTDAWRTLPEPRTSLREFAQGYKNGELMKFFRSEEG